MIAPAWAQPLADDLAITRVDSFAAGIAAAPHRTVVAVDVTPSGTNETNRRDLLTALAGRHRRVITITRDAARPDFLAPFAPEDELDTAQARQQHADLLAQFTFPGPDLTRGQLAALLDLQRPPRPRRAAFGPEYLRYERPIRPKTPVATYKRMYAALDPAGRLVVAGAYARDFVPIEAKWQCCHDDVTHHQLGPECYYGFSAYANREDALGRNDPSAAVATVEFSRRVMTAGGGVVRPELRGEHQRVIALEFPPLCRTRSCLDQGRPRPATMLSGAPEFDDDAGEYDGYTELVQMCQPCAREKHRAPAVATSHGRGPWPLSDLSSTLGTSVALSWLPETTT